VIGARSMNDRREKLALLVFEHDSRTQKIRPCLAARGIRSMAKGAVDAIDRFTAIKHLLRSLRPRWISGQSSIKTTSPTGHSRGDALRSNR
jgi:hypothetical protein